jgi:hypothetical protein
LIFVSRGSYFQLLVATIACLGFGFTAAWCQPFQSRAANLFKVATEVTLLLTLVIAGMLRVEVTNGTLPALLLNGDMTGIDEDGVGMLLFLANTVVPGASLLIAWVEIGAQDRTGPNFWASKSDARHSDRSPRCFLAEEDVRTRFLRASPILNVGHDRLRHLRRRPYREGTSGRRAPPHHRDDGV